MFVESDDELPEPRDASAPQRLVQLEEDFAELKRRHVRPDEDAALHELRRLVPHLSPSFACAERDAFLLASAIRAGVAVGGASWEERLAAVDGERRAALARLERRSQDCEGLKDEVADLRQRLRATRQEAQASSALLAQKRDEARKQLLLEESRTQKLHIRNKQLEMELERLKEMLHHQLRK